MVLTTNEKAALAAAHMRTAQHFELGCLQHHPRNRRSTRSNVGKIIAGGRADSSQPGLDMSGKGA